MPGKFNAAMAADDTTADEAIRHARTALGSPGSFFDASERLAVAGHARMARGLAASAPELPAALPPTAARIAVEAMTTRPEHLTAWEAGGRDLLAYVELVSVVAQISSIDSYRIGLGAELDPLPEPRAGDPVPVIDERAATTNAWVPTVGPAVAPTALSALPDEKAAKDALGAVWYLTDDVIHQYGVEPGRELTRPQMELVAARTSWLNECFF